MSPALRTLPDRSTYSTGSSVRLLVDAPAAAAATLRVTHLGTTVHTSSVEVGEGRTALALPALPDGSYAVTVTAKGSLAQTAFDILAHAGSRPRYGFLADFRPGRADGAEIADGLRAMHLTHVQFYDWMYRHAELLPPEDEFVDTLGQRLSLRTVRGLVEACHDAGSRALAYAAVYAAGKDYAAEHPDQLVHKPDGTPWMLGDFLWNTDLRPGSPWVSHIVEQMGTAVEAVGFDGLHLDQYGDPKLATAADGGLVDYADAFPAFIDAVRDRLTRATLIFNNVNDFPTRTTIHAAQDATYIEVWSPHDSHHDLVTLVRRARDLAPTRPVILAAYLEPFADACGAGEVASAKLALATVWAEGGQYLLFGERDGVLVHPYYPNFATLGEEAAATLRAFADFAVATGDLLHDPGVLEATTHLTGGINQDVHVDGVPVSLVPQAGAVWVRVSTRGPRLVIQLVDFRAQTDDRWNAVREETGHCEGVRVRVRATSRTPTVLFGSPAGGPHLEPVTGSPVDGGTVEVPLPAFDTWGLLVVDR